MPLRLRAGRVKKEMKMRRKITSVIILCLLICLSVGKLAKNGRETGTGDGSESGIERLSWEENPEEPVKGAKEKGAGSADRESMPEKVTGAASEKEAREKDDFTLREELRPAILQIFCGNFRGSGVVWEMTDEEVVVAGSGHLLKNGETCEVLCYAGVYYEAKVERILGDCDVGFAVFPISALREDEVELTAVMPSARKAEEFVRGEELIVYGSMDSVAENFVKGYIIEAESRMQIEGSGSAQDYLLGGIVREKSGKTGLSESGEAGESAAKGEDGEAAGGAEDAAEKENGAVDAGMSGSGVFDRTGKLVGILAGGDGESGFAAVPVWRVLFSCAQAARRAGEKLS